MGPSGRLGYITQLGFIHQMGVWTVLHLVTNTAVAAIPRMGRSQTEMELQRQASAIYYCIVKILSLCGF